MNLLILDAGHAEKVAGKRNEKENFFEWKFNDSMQYKIKKRADVQKKYKSYKRKANVYICLI